VTQALSGPVSERALARSRTEIFQIGPGEFPYPSSFASEEESVAVASRALTRMEA
jgi:hypothetical protein